MFKKLLTGLVLALPIPALAEVERQLDAHVHGESVATLAEDNGRFELELELPGANIVGFEHPPRNTQQQAAIDQALAWFQQQQWVLPDAGGECTIDSVRAHTHGYREDHDNHENGGENGRENGDEHHHDDHAHHHDHDHDHAEFHVTVTFACDRPERLRWLELPLFERFPDNEVLIVNIFTASGQSQIRLDRDNARVVLP